MATTTVQGSVKRAPCISFSICKASSGAVPKDPHGDEHWISTQEKPNQVLPNTLDTPILPILTRFFYSLMPKTLESRHSQNLLAQNVCWESRIQMPLPPMVYHPNMFYHHFPSQKFPMGTPIFSETSIWSILFCISKFISIHLPSIKSLTLW